ncbi:MAG: M1 family metallopeptidase [Chitinophagales bacterium]
MKLRPIVSFILCLGFASAYSQNAEKNSAFTRADSLRGSVTPERAWWNVLHYDIQIRPDFESKTITGSNKIQFAVTKPGRIMQIDLQEPLIIQKILWNQTSLKFSRTGNVFYVEFPSSLKAGSEASISIEYGGNPIIAKRPPWDGGWIFTTDKLGRPWMTVACEGIGASIWYPCKDYLGDEPDHGASLSVTVPDTLVAVGNGRLQQKKSNADGSTTFTWSVKSPINNYNIVPYIGKYVGWHEIYPGEKGKLDCDYWVLDYNEAKARQQFKAVDSMLRSFEYWMGPYPFYEDGYKLVEAPHLGMEHQSDVAYGNKFRQGYAGMDLSGSGWGLKWDFIIVHESGHEWFGNNITCKDIADEWIHEGFTNYTETLYTDYYFGKAAGNAYNLGIRKNIENKSPIIGHYGVNNEPEGTDEYYKAGNMLHTIRQIISNDELFREILRGLNKTFYHQTVTTKQVEDYISQHAKIDFSKVFDQYLRNTQIPVLEYATKGNTTEYRWTNCIPGFNMAARVNDQFIHPTEQWQNLSTTRFDIDRNLYFDSRKSE